MPWDVYGFEFGTTKRAARKVKPHKRKVRITKGEREREKVYKALEKKRAKGRAKTKRQTKKIWRKLI